MPPEERWTATVKATTDSRPAPRCVNCRFERRGECHEDSPPVNWDEPHRRAVWPIIDLADWCGKWKRAK